MPNSQRQLEGAAFRIARQPTGHGPPIGFPPLQLAGDTAQHNFLSEARLSPSAEPPSVTPLHFQAGQVPGNCNHSTALASFLIKELKDNTAIVSDAFIDRLFPKEHLPFQIDSRVFNALPKWGYWRPSKYLFEGMVYTESGMAKWLNDVGKTMGKSMAIPPSATGGTASATCHLTVPLSIGSPTLFSLVVNIMKGWK